MNTKTKNKMRTLIFAGLIIITACNMTACKTNGKMEKDTLRITLKGNTFESPYRTKKWKQHFEDPMLDGGILVERRTHKGFSGTILISYANGNMCCEWNYTDGIEMGWQTDYYDNGQIHIKKRIDIPEYPPRESYREYYEYDKNGTLRHTFVVVETEGKRQYKHILYHPNGQKQSEGNSLCIMPPPESEEEFFPFLSRTGHWTTYHENGKKASEGEWGIVENKDQWGSQRIQNIRIGKWKQYDE